MTQAARVRVTVQEMLDLRRKYDALRAQRGTLVEVMKALLDCHEDRCDGLPGSPCPHLAEARAALAAVKKETNEYPGQAGLPAVNHAPTGDAMTPAESAAKIVAQVFYKPGKHPTEEEKKLVMLIATALAAQDAEIERLKTAYGALAPVAIELRTERDALEAEIVRLSGEAHGAPAVGDN